MFCTSFLSTLKKTFFIDKPRLINYREQIDEVHYNATLIHIYFKELGVVKYSRDELFGIIDVIGDERRQILDRLTHLA